MNDTQERWTLFEYVGGPYDGELCDAPRDTDDDRYVLRSNPPHLSALAGWQRAAERAAANFSRGTPDHYVRMIWDDTQTHTSPRADIDITERTASQLDRLIQALRSGEDHEARVIADAFCDHTPSCTALIETLLAPALRHILVLRADNIVSEYVKQRACAIVHGIVGDHSACSTQVAGPRSVIATLTGEHHRLPARMGAVALREDGWQVEEVSGPLEPDELATAAIENQLDLVVISRATEASLPATAKLKQLLEPAGIPVIACTLDHSLYELQRLARRASLATTF